MPTKCFLDFREGLEYEMLSNISCFTDLKYAFIALVMLLFQPVKKCALQYSLSHI